MQYHQSLPGGDISCSTSDRIYVKSGNRLTVWDNSIQKCCLQACFDFENIYNKFQFCNEIAVSNSVCALCNTESGEIFCVDVLDTSKYVIMQHSKLSKHRIRNFTAARKEDCCMFYSQKSTVYALLPDRDNMTTDSRIVTVFTDKAHVISGMFCHPTLPLLFIAYQTVANANHGGCLLHAYNYTEVLTKARQVAASGPAKGKKAEPLSPLQVAHAIVTSNLLNASLPPGDGTSAVSADGICTGRAAPIDISMHNCLVHVANVIGASRGHSAPPPAPWSEDSVVSFDARGRWLAVATAVNKVIGVYDVSAPLFEAALRRRAAQDEDEGDEDGAIQGGGGGGPKSAPIMELLALGSYPLATNWTVKVPSAGHCLSGVCFHPSEPLLLCLVSRRLAEAVVDVTRPEPTAASQVAILSLVNMQVIGSTEPPSGVGAEAGQLSMYRDIACVSHSGVIMLRSKAGPASNCLSLLTLTQGFLAQHGSCRNIISNSIGYDTQRSFVIPPASAAGKDSAKAADKEGEELEASDGEKSALSGAVCVASSGGGSAAYAVISTLTPQRRSGHHGNSAPPPQSVAAYTHELFHCSVVPTTTVPVPGARGQDAGATTKSQMHRTLVAGIPSKVHKGTSVTMPTTEEPVDGGPTRVGGSRVLSAAESYRALFGFQVVGADKEQLAGVLGDGVNDTATFTPLRCSVTSLLFPEVAAVSDAADRTHIGASLAVVSGVITTPKQGAQENGKEKSRDVGSFQAEQTVVPSVCLIISAPTSIGAGGNATVATVGRGRATAAPVIAPVPVTFDSVSTATLFACYTDLAVCNIAWSKAGATDAQHSTTTALFAVAGGGGVGDGRQSVKCFAVVAAAPTIPTCRFTNELVFDVDFTVPGMELKRIIAAPAEGERSLHKKVLLVVDLQCVDDFGRNTRKQRLLCCENTQAALSALSVSLKAQASAQGQAGGADAGSDVCWLDLRESVREQAGGAHLAAFAPAHEVVLDVQFQNRFQQRRDATTLAGKSTGFDSHFGITDMSGGVVPLVAVLTSHRVCMLRSDSMKLVASFDNGGNCVIHSICWLGCSITLLLSTGSVEFLCPYEHLIAGSRLRQPRNRPEYGFGRAVRAGSDADGLSFGHGSLYSVPQHLLGASGAGGVQLMGYLSDRCYIMAKHSGSTVDSYCVLSPAPPAHSCGLTTHVLMRPCVAAEPLILSLLALYQKGCLRLSAAQREVFLQYLLDVVVLHYPSSLYANAITTSANQSSFPSSHATSTLCNALRMCGFPLLALVVADVTLNAKETLRMCNSRNYRSHRWLTEVFKFELCLSAATAGAPSSVAAEDEGMGKKGRVHVKAADACMLVDIACNELLAGRAELLDVFIDPESTGGSTGAMPHPLSFGAQKFKKLAEILAILGNFVHAVKFADLSGDDSHLVYLLLLHALTTMEGRTRPAVDLDVTGGASLSEIMRRILATVLADPMSHDISTALTAVVANVRLIEKSLSNSNNRHPVLQVVLRQVTAVLEDNIRETKAPKPKLTPALGGSAVSTLKPIKPLGAAVALPLAGGLAKPAGGGGGGSVASRRRASMLGAKAGAPLLGAAPGALAFIKDNEKDKEKDDKSGDKSADNVDTPAESASDARADAKAATAAAKSSRSAESESEEEEERPEPEKVEPKLSDSEAAAISSSLDEMLLQVIAAVCAPATIAAPDGKAAVDVSEAGRPVGLTRAEVHRRMSLCAWKLDSGAKPATTVSGSGKWPLLPSCVADVEALDKYHAQLRNRLYLARHPQASATASHSFGLGLPAGLLELYLESPYCIANAGSAGERVAANAGDALGQLVLDNLDEYMFSSSLDAFPMGGGAPGGATGGGGVKGGAGAAAAGAGRVHWVDCVGEGKEVDLAVAYCRFSDLLTPDTCVDYDVTFVSSGADESGAGAAAALPPFTCGNFVDLSKFARQWELVLDAVGSTGVNATRCALEESQSTVDPGEGGHEKVKALMDLVFNPVGLAAADAVASAAAAKTAAGLMFDMLEKGFVSCKAGNGGFLQWGVRAKLRKGSPLDVGMYHASHPSRNAATFELSVCPQFAVRAKGEKAQQVLLCRCAEVEGGAGLMLLWALVLDTETGSLSVVMGGNTDAACSATSLAAGGKKPKSGVTCTCAALATPQTAEQPATWTHVALAFDCNNQAGNGCRVTVFLDGEMSQQAVVVVPTLPKADGGEYCHYLFLCPNIQSSLRVTELRVWAAVRSSSEIEKYKDNFLPLASKRKRLQYRIGGSKKLFQSSCASDVSLGSLTQVAPKGAVATASASTSGKGGAVTPAGSGKLGGLAAPSVLSAPGTAAGVAPAPAAALAKPGAIAGAGAAAGSVASRRRASMMTNKAGGPPGALAPPAASVATIATLDTVVTVSEKLTCVRLASGAVEKYELGGAVAAKVLPEGQGAGKEALIKATLADPKLAVTALIKVGEGGAPSTHVAVPSTPLSLACGVARSLDEAPQQILKYSVSAAKPVQLVRFKAGLAYKRVAATAAAPTLFSIAKLTLQVSLSPNLTHFDTESIVVQVSLGPLAAGGTGLGIGELKLHPTLGGNYNVRERVLQWTLKPAAGTPLPAVLEYQALIQLTATTGTTPEVPKSPTTLPGIVKLSLARGLLSQITVDIEEVSVSGAVSLQPKPVERLCRAEYKFL